MSSSAEYVFNEDVQLTKERRIAVRGLTRNHVGSILVWGEGESGMIKRVRNFGNVTEVTLSLTTADDHVVTFPDALTVVTVTD